MFQAPVATTTQPARPTFKLAGHVVTQDMFYAVQQAKRARRRCIYVSAGEPAVSPNIDSCANCGGFGYMALEVVVGGPFKDAPQGAQGSADENPTVHLRPAWHNKAWWSVARDLYPCPLCNDKRDVQF